MLLVSAIMHVLIIYMCEACMPGKERDEALFPAVVAAHGPGALEETAEQSLSTETPEFCSGSV